MVRIFLTGASGYLGGEVLYQLKQSSSLSGAELACLNRNSSKAEQILRAYPDVRIVEGDLDQTEVITKEAEKADIVLHMASTKHAPSANAIVTGLVSPSRSVASPPNSIPTWIQISGATLYASSEIAASKFGTSASSVHTYSDTADVVDINFLIRSSPTRAVEQLAVSQSPDKVRTALIIGPLIYGTGRGPCHSRSIQAPDIARATLTLGHGFRLLQGENAWSNVHVSDVGSLVVSLAEAAAPAHGVEGEGVGWNENGTYHPEAGEGTELSFGKLGGLIAKEAAKQGLIAKEGAEEPLEEVSVEKANELGGAHAAVLWGTNALIKGERARKAPLGWAPKGPGLREEIPAIVSREAAEMKGA